MRMKITARDVVEVVGALLVVGGFLMELTPGIAMISCGVLLLAPCIVGRIRR